MGRTIRIKRTLVKPADPGKYIIDLFERGEEYAVENNVVEFHDSIVEEGISEEKFNLINEKKISIFNNTGNELVMNNKNKDNNMSKLNELYTNTNSTASNDFANISEDGMYLGRLAGQIMLKQSKEFTKEGEEPKELVTFIFDLINDNGESVHVRTKPSSFSFGEKAKLPGLWNVKSAKELQELIVDTDKDCLKDVFVKCMVEVDHKENGDFPRVTKVSKIMATTDQTATALNKWDLKPYGQEPTDVFLTPDYEAATPSDLV